MRGFGNLKDMEALKAITNVSEETPLIEATYTEKEQAMLENVYVPDMETDEYQVKEKETPKGSSGQKEIVPDKEKKRGAAGNSEEKKEEPIMGGMGLGSGIGSGIKKEMTRMESFTPEQVVDEEPKKFADDNFKENKMDKIKDMFNDVFDNKFGKAQKKDYDYDATVTNSRISQTPIKKIPKGW